MMGIIGDLNEYPLVMTNSLPWYRWPIEIDDVPSELNLHLWLGFSMAMLNNQMVGVLYMYN
jgi:hypothetical protein